MYGRSGREGRITREVGFLDLVDLLGRGGTEDWQRLYERAKGDLALRDGIREALLLVDPEMGSARVLWEGLLARLDAEHSLRRD